MSAVRLTERTAAQLADLFAKAREQRSPATDGSVLIPRAPRPGDDAHWASAAVRVGVLGPHEVKVPGQMDEVRLGLATEVATYLALQTAPVHPSVLAASVWPRGVTAEVRDATIERVREWLGQATDGSYLLRENDEGRLFLADDVAVDWHAFCTLVQRSRGVAVRTEMELLRRALQLIRGPFLDGRERGRYTWLARTRLDTTVRRLRRGGGAPAGRAVHRRPGRRRRCRPRRAAAGAALPAVVARPAAGGVRRPGRAGRRRRGRRDVASCCPSAVPSWRPRPRRWSRSWCRARASGGTLVS